MSEPGKTDYYVTLGLNKDDNPDEAALKEAYRKLARTHHPDKGGDEEKFKEIAEAYEILSDPNKRKNYDQYGHDGLSAHAAATAAAEAAAAAAAAEAEAVAAEAAKYGISPKDLNMYRATQAQHINSELRDKTPKEWLEYVNFEKGVNKVLTTYNKYCDENLSGNHKINDRKVRERMRRDIRQGISPFDNLDEYATNLGNEKKRDLTEEVIQRVNTLISDKNDLISEENAKSHKIIRHPYGLFSIDNEYVQRLLAQPPLNWNVDAVVDELSDNFTIMHKLHDMKFIIEDRDMLKGRVKNFQSNECASFLVDTICTNLRSLLPEPWRTETPEENLKLLNRTLYYILKGQAWNVDNAIIVFKQHIDEATKNEIEGDKYW